MTESNEIYPSSILRHTGRVKWFNPKNGYGFITPIKIEGDPEIGGDVFVHHSSLSVSNDQYRYLIIGEYVDFFLERSNNNTHQFQSVDVTGIRRGPLMCETRFVPEEEKRSPSRAESVDKSDGYIRPSPKRTFSNVNKRG